MSGKKEYRSQNNEFLLGSEKIRKEWVLERGLDNGVRVCWISKTVKVVSGSRSSIILGRNSGCLPGWEGALNILEVSSEVPDSSLRI